MLAELVGDVLDKKIEREIWWTKSDNLDLGQNRIKPIKINDTWVKSEKVLKNEIVF